TMRTRRPARVSQSARTRPVGPAPATSTSLRSMRIAGISINSRVMPRIGGGLVALAVGGAVFLLVAADLLLPPVTARVQATDSITICGKAQLLRLYGQRGNPPVVVSSGDGGWVHLGPHVADLLARRGFFVVGVDAKAYLESFTSRSTTLRPEDEP